MGHDPYNLQKRGQRVALVIAGVALGWMLVTAIGAEYGWSNRIRALFDLAALAGFGMAFWMIYGLWRDRRKDRATEE